MGALGQINSATNVYTAAEVDALTSLFTQTADQTVGNTTTETTLFGTGVGSLTLPANFFTVGKSIKIKMYGYIGAAASGTTTLKAKLGGTIVCQSAAAVNIPVLTSPEFWSIEVIITCQTTGAAGTIMAQGAMIYHDATVTGSMVEMVQTTTVVIDTTASKVIDLTYQWATAAAADTLTCTNATIQTLR